MLAVPEKYGHQPGCAAHLDFNIFGNKSANKNINKQNLPHDPGI